VRGARGAGRVATMTHNYKRHGTTDLFAHKSASVEKWLAHPKRARWHVHVTPTSSSWLKLVEGWFAQITNQRIKKGAFNSVQHLQDAIGDWTEGWNEDSKPFVWKKPADEIIAKVKRGRAALALVNSVTDHYLSRTLEL
jgi:hypothetical protein